MKKLKQCVGLLTGLLLLSCSNADRTVSKSTIDVAGAMENLQELKVSQLGSKIKFVPLETNDSTLVANHWNFLVTDKYVIVSNMGYGSSQKCMTFDLNTGKYIATVGHPGQDPEAYGNCIPIMDESESDVLYFFTPKGRLVKYSMDGRFLGSINSKIANRRLTSYPLINDTVMTAVLSGSTLEGDRYISLLRMDLEMNLIDSIAVVTQGNPIDPYARIRYSEAFIQEHPSLMPHSGLTFRKLKGKREDAGQMVEEISGSNQMWQTNGSVRFHQAFNDSIYDMSAEGTPITYVFDTGKWRYPVEEAGKTVMTSAHAFVTDVTETTDKIIFAVSNGWFGEDNKGYVGLYDKKSGATTMGEIEKGFEDDLTGFAPFYPVRTNGKGQLIGVMTIEDITKWVEKHPAEKRPTFIETLAEDANPVLVIVES